MKPQPFLASQDRRLVQEIHQSRLPHTTQDLLLQVLKHSLEEANRPTTQRLFPVAIVCSFQLADWAYRLKTERAVLQQAIQQAEDVGLLCLEPIPYFKEEYFLRWTPERMVLQPHQYHVNTYAGNQHPAEAECELPALDEAEPSPQYWKGRPPRRIWRQLRQAVLARDERTCHYCGTRSGRMTCDHKIPVSRGGSSTLDNLVTACLKCNSAKATRTAEEWVQTRTRQPRREAR
jgi:hypothetical protein